ncbi:hypothetical protein ACS3QZ_04830 [Shimia sp. W99]
MWKRLLGCALAVGLCGPGQAETAWQKIKKGAKETGEAIGKGAEAVGNTVSDGADAVGKTLDSTGELISNEETPEATRARLDASSESIMARLLTENAKARALYDQSAGYAVFDSRRVTVFPVTAGYGRGVAVTLPKGERTYMNMSSGGVGAAIGIGGFVNQFVILFETPADFEDFVVNGLDASAGGETMSGEDRSDGNMRFVDGRSFFFPSKKGWRVGATAEGTKYWRSPELN